MAIIGIDPGVDGAIAVVDPGPRVSTLWALPKERKADLFRLICSQFDIERAVIESQWAMPRQGRSAIAEQMRAYGEIQGVLQALELRVLYVRAADWKRRVGLTRGSASMTNTAWKARILPHARAVPGFVDALPVRCTKAFEIGAADATCMALATANTIPGLERYRWRF